MHVPDIRYVQRVEVDNRRNGSLTLYTSERKTSSSGARREKYLPLVAPAEGVTTDDWVGSFATVYELCGLNLWKEPLGPLMPAPRGQGLFFARPLSTSEAAVWLKLLLQGTPNS